MTPSSSPTTARRPTSAADVDQSFHGTVGGTAAHHSGHNGDGHDEGHSEGHREAIEHLSRYVTNNFVDDRDTNVDDSVNQQIHTDGGDVLQDIETHSTTASGDGSVAAGGDIRDSQVTSGNDNQVGTGNVRGDNNVQGDDNRLVHGDEHHRVRLGRATNAHLDDVHVGGGSALSVTGDANGIQANQDDHTHTSNTFTNETHVDDSGNSSTESNDNSGNDTHLRSDVDDEDTQTHNYFESDNTFDDVDHLIERSGPARGSPAGPLSIAVSPETQERTPDGLPRPATSST